MYPLIALGPFNLSSGGLLLLGAIVVGSWLIERFAHRRGGAALADQAAGLILPVLIGAALGGRLWFGLLNWDRYGPNPQLFLALRIADFAWPGALFGGTLAAWLWCRRKGYAAAELADAAAIGLPFAQAIAWVGLLLSGEAFGYPTTAPWGIPLFGAIRHPTQIYFALAALLSGIALHILARRPLPAGALFGAFLGYQGLTWLLLEPFRADSLLLPFGMRSAQVFGLGLLLGVLAWFRAHTGREPLPERVDATSPSGGE
jgi:phosphatidylglycerol:prolipoprotein diacylglycerol transferase